MNLPVPSIKKTFFLFVSVSMLFFFARCGDDDSGESLQDGSIETPDGSRLDSHVGTDATQNGPDAETNPCEDGPLEEPIPGCQPMPVPDTGDKYADCVARINQFRWECQCLPPLERWTDGEACADEQAEYDSTHGPHAGFQANICSPRGSAQNECPGWGSVSQVLQGCLQMMWDEGPGEPFSEHGHYINMSNTNYNRVACGFYTTSGGAVWAVQNFSP